MTTNDRYNLIQLLKSVLSPVEVYDSNVPESSDADVAVAISNISHNISGRTIEGNTTGEWSVWRLQVVGKTLSLINNTLIPILNLDNTKTDVFQRIFVKIINEEDRELNNPFRRTFVDVSVYSTNK